MDYLPIDLDSDYDDDHYMSSARPVRSSTVVDVKGRIAFHPRMMRKLGIEPGATVVIKERFGAISLYVSPE